jgi:trans-aconitate methyltransferase
MNLIDRAGIKRYHDWHVEEHGEGTIRALGWRHSEDQLVRYSILAKIGDMNDHSVLDIGCGHGDLRAYLAERYPRLHYSGIDQIESFLAIAADRHGHLPNTTFYQGDCYTADLPHADYVLVCGSLNYHSSEKDYVYKMITRLFNTCQVALGFNLLSNVDAPGGILVTYDAGAIMRYCRTLTDKVILLDDYFDGDFTVWMYK